MPKYYVILIDNNNLGYMGVKSQLNPYNDAPWWNGGSPNLFGGNNDRRTPLETIYHEAREESHFKIDIDTMAAQPVQVYQYGDMTFFAIRGNFAYQPNPYFPNVLAQKDRYRETTGEIMTVNLMTLDTTSRFSTGANALWDQIKQGVDGSQTVQGMYEFMDSEMAEALRRAAVMVQQGQL